MSTVPLLSDPFSCYRTIFPRLLCPPASSSVWPIRESLREDWRAGERQKPEYFTPFNLCSCGISCSKDTPACPSVATAPCGSFHHDSSSPWMALAPHLHRTTSSLCPLGPRGSSSFLLLLIWGIPHHSWIPHSSILCVTNSLN